MVGTVVFSCSHALGVLQTNMFVAGFSGCDFVVALESRFCVAELAALRTTAEDVNNSTSTFGVADDVAMRHLRGLCDSR